VQQVFRSLEVPFQEITGYSLNGFRAATAGKQRLSWPENIGLKQSW
jgi:hypothetical protein